MAFIPGVPPTLETMLQAGFLREDDKPAKQKQKEIRDGTRETDGHQ